MNYIFNVFWNTVAPALGHVAPPFQPAESEAPDGQPPDEERQVAPTITPSSTRQRPRENINVQGGKVVFNNDFPVKSQISDTAYKYIQTGTSRLFNVCTVRTDRRAFCRYTCCGLNCSFKMKRSIDPITLQEEEEFKVCHKIQKLDGGASFRTDTEHSTECLRADNEVIYHIAPPTLFYLTTLP